MNPQTPDPVDAGQNQSLQPAPQTANNQLNAQETLQVNSSAPEGSNTPTPYPVQPPVVQPPQPLSPGLSDQNPFAPQASPPTDTSGLNQSLGAMPAVPPPSLQPVVTPVPSSWNQPAVVSTTTPLTVITAASAAQSNKEQKRKKLIRNIIIGIASLTIITAIAGFIFFKLNSGLKLTSISTTDYSLLVPEGYKEKAGNDVISYEEPEGNEDTRSGVFVFHESYPGGTSLTSQQKEQFFKAAEQIPKTMLTTIGVSAKDFKVERTKFKKNDALKFSGRIDDGEKSGELRGMFILGDKAFYMVFVAAHKSDPGLTKKMDKIINSFEVNQ